MTAPSGAIAVTVPARWEIIAHLAASGSAPGARPRAGQAFPARRRQPPFHQASGGRDPVLSAAPPQMADGQRQRVGGVRGPRRVAQPEQPHHHGRDLGLVRPAAAGHRRLHLAWGMQRDRQAAPRRAHDRHRPRLRRAHHGTDVVLAEHPLHRDRVRPVLGQPVVDLLLEREQARRDVGPRRRADHIRVDQAGRPARAAVHGADAAAGQAGIDAEHPHASPPGLRKGFTNMCSVPTLPRGCRRAGQRTAACRHEEAAARPPGPRPRDEGTGPQAIGGFRGSLPRASTAL